MTDSGRALLILAAVCLAVPGAATGAGATTDGPTAGLLQTDIEANGSAYLGPFE